MRELVATEEVRESLGLIVRGRKDRSADRAVFGFADEHAEEEINEAVKDLDSKERGKFEDELCDG